MFPLEPRHLNLGSNLEPIRLIQFALPSGVFFYGGGSGRSFLFQEKSNILVELYEVFNERSTVPLRLNDNFAATCR